MIVVVLTISSNLGAEPLAAGRSSPFLASLRRLAAGP